MSNLLPTTANHQRLTDIKKSAFNFWTISLGILALFVLVGAVTIVVGNRLIGSSQSELAGVGYIAAFLGAGLKAVFYCSPIVAAVPLLFDARGTRRASGCILATLSVMIAIAIVSGV